MGEPRDSSREPADDDGQHQEPLDPRGGQDSTDLPEPSHGLGVGLPHGPADDGPDDDEYERL